MILTDYLTQSDELMARWAKQLGVNHAVIRLPEDGAFDPSDLSHWKSYYRRFEALGLRPIVVETRPSSAPGRSCAIWASCASRRCA